jgi:flagellar basal-body rod protein FlgB
MTSPPNLLSTLENFLKLSTTRQHAIASNMANIDTPGYHTTDLDFDHEMQRATTNASFTPTAHEVPNLMERPDGNNVDIDREGLLLSQTQLQYQIGVQLVKHHFHGLLSAISGGS